MKKRNKKEKDNVDIIEDDGRVIASMNVDGMPWYTPARSEQGSDNKPPLGKKETRSFMFSALLAALLVGAVFIVAAALFSFCHPNLVKVVMKDKKQNDFVDKHIVSCTHCGKDVLDHMTSCPFCKSKLTPAGYAPLDPAKMKKIKLLAWIVLGSVALVIAIFIIASKY